MEVGDVQIAFELPQDSEKMAELVEAIPNGWSGLTGRLDILPIMADMAAVGVGYRFEGVSVLECGVVGVSGEGGKRAEPDYREIVSGGRRPSFVEFYLDHPYAIYRVIDRARGLAAAIVRSGFRGELFFHLDDSRQGTRALIRLFLSQPGGQGRVVVRLIDQTIEGLSPEDRACIEPFVALCRAQGLREMVPVPA